MFWRLTTNWMEGRTKKWLMLEKIGQTMYLEIGSIQWTLFGRFFYTFPPNLGCTFGKLAKTNRTKIDEKYTDGKGLTTVFKTRSEKIQLCRTYGMNSM